MLLVSCEEVFSCTESFTHENIFVQIILHLWRSNSFGGFDGPIWLYLGSLHSIAPISIKNVNKRIYIYKDYKKLSEENVIKLYEKSGESIQCDITLKRRSWP